MRPVTAVTVKVVAPEIPADVAVIMVDATDIAVAKPDELIVATEVFEDVQADDAVRSFVELSEYVPVAVNCTVVPVAADGFAGVTAMDFRVRGIGLTVKLTVVE